MTTGALIFAYNNEVTDYLAMAQWSAKNIERHLGIPTHIVTGTPKGTNSRYFSDYDNNVTWHNETRTNAYELSPWDRTLVLDADYVVASDQLKVLLEANKDFLAHQTAYDITGLQDFNDLNHFGQYNMPMAWATVMMFRRSKTAELIFDTMSMVRDNWDHYRALYHNNRHTYRNDHALSIALNVVNGHVLDYPTIPWPLASLIPGHKLSQLDQDSYRIDYQAHDGRPRWIKLTGQDFHAMGKKHLGDIVASNA